MEMIKDMYKKGWNRSVLPKYKYELGPNSFTLPKIPPMDEWQNYCACSNTKS